MIVGGYTLELYCDNAEEGDGIHRWNMWSNPDVFAGQTNGECVKAARRAGWIIGRNDKCYCPICAKKRTRAE